MMKELMKEPMKEVMKEPMKLKKRVEKFKYQCIDVVFVTICLFPFVALKQM